MGMWTPERLTALESKVAAIGELLVLQIELMSLASLGQFNMDKAKKLTELMDRVKQS